MKINLEKGLSESQLKKPVSHYMEKVDTGFSASATVSDVLTYLRSRKLETKTSYFYAVDGENRLFGYFSARDLVFSEPHRTIGEIAVDDIIKVCEDSPMDKALMMIVENQLMAVPVVNAQGHLKGLIEVIPPQFDQAKEIKNLKSTSTRDFFQLVGISVVLGRAAAGAEEFRSRMPWLLCNIFSGLICAAIANLFELTLAKVVILAMFIPRVDTIRIDLYASNGSFAAVPPPKGCAMESCTQKAFNRSTCFLLIGTHQRRPRRTGLFNL